MTFAKRPQYAYLLPAFFLPLCLTLGSCARKETAPGYQGYVEAEFVRVAAPFAGTLDKLLVARGQTVAAGASLFVLEQENEAAARREAEERLRAAEAQLTDLRKGKRPVELDVARAQLAQGIAAEQLSSVQLTRDEQLVGQGFISKEKLDTSRASLRRDSARVAELRDQLRSAQLASREDQIRAQAFEVDAARAALAQSDWRLKQKSVGAAKSGLVFDTIYAEGEWVPAGSPVISLLPPGNVKVRFFVPEAALGGLKPGAQIAVRCDGCDRVILATISYISPQAEFTPPVIYSNETRAKLVFMIEARPATEEAVHLRPGQPVEVSLR
jgi:HlyD family secretion protein